MCGIHSTDQMPTPVMPITDSTETGSSRSQYSRRPSSRYGVTSHSAPEINSDMIVSRRPLSPPSTIGRTVKSSVTTSSQTTPHLVLRMPRVRQREGAFVQALHAAGEGEPGEHQQRDAERGHPRLDGVDRRERLADRVGRGVVEPQALDQQLRDAAPALQRRDRHVHDQQREQRGVGLRADRHRPVDALDPDEPADPVAEQVDERADRREPLGAQRHDRLHAEILRPR